MPIDRVVGVQLRDEAGYLEYRRRIAPLLASYGAHFVLDVRVSEVVRAPIEGRPSWRPVGSSSPACIAPGA